MTKTSNFLGTWVLDPTQSRYELGNPPQNGTYIIEPDGERLIFKMAWTDSENQAHTASFDGIPDGELHPLAETAVADTVCLTLEDPQTLTSTAYKAGQLILHAQRTLIDSGNTMTVVQSGHTPTGPYANRSVYRRTSTS